MAGQGVSVRDSVPGHVTKLSRYIRPQKTLRLGTVKASTILSGNVLVVCFEFRALMVACGGRHIEKSTILQWRVRSKMALTEFLSEEVEPGCRNV